MTTCTEARRLLEEEIKAVVVASQDTPKDSYFRGRLSGMLWVRDRILAQPEPAAREAALVRALKDSLEPLDYEGSFEEWEKRARALIADTSPAAPLAQGERLRELTEAAASVVEGEHLSRELGACEVHNAVDLCWWDKRIANLRAALGEEKE